MQFWRRSMRSNLLLASNLLLVCANQMDSNVLVDDFSLMQSYAHTSEQKQPSIPSKLKAGNITFLHIEKSGGTVFIDVLTALPGMCRIENTTDLMLLRQKNAHAAWRAANCAPGAWTPVSDYLLVGSGSKHWSGMGDEVLFHKYYAGHTVSMFRQPEQRIISGYYDEYHSWRKSTPPKNLLDYAHFIQGCTTKMLTRSGYPCEHGENPTANETVLAVSRLHNYLFVGITEQWDLSVCLLHKMFGGKCLQTDWGEKPVGANASSYDVEHLHGFVDVSDRSVYSEALKIFNQQLKKYHVSYDSCKKCFDEAANP